MSGESINPNTPVNNVSTSNDQSGRVDIDAGGGPLTFDELEQALASKPAKKANSEESKTEKRKDLTNDADKSKPAKKENQDDKATPEKKDIKKDADNPEEDKPVRKTVKAKYADNELDLDEEAVIPVKINGKEEFIQVKDLVSNYSGKTAWDQKFSELHKIRKGVATHEAKLQETANTIKSIFEEKDQDMKIFKMAQLAGIDPIKFRQNFFDNQISLLEKYYQMTEDERNADALAFEAKYQKHRADTLENSTKHEQAHKELTARLDSLRARHKVSEDEFVQTYEKLSAQEKKLAEQYSDYEVNKITPELVIESIEKERLWKSAAEKLDSLQLGLSEEARGQRLFKLVTDAHKIGLSSSDVSDLIDEVWGSKKNQKLIEEKRKQTEEFRSGKKPATQVGLQKEEPLFFGDL